MRVRCARRAVWEKALRHDWPVTLGPGICAARTRPGRALLGFCDWIETDFSAGASSSSAAVGRHRDRDGRRGLHGGAGGADARARRSRLGTRDLRRWRSGALRKSYERAPAIRTYRTTTARCARQARELTGKVLDVDRQAHRRRFPSRSGRPRAAADVVEAALAFRRALDRAPAASSIIAPRRRSSTTSTSCARSDRSRARSPRRCASSASASSRCRWRRSARARAISMSCALQQAGYAGRPHLFVVGLEEGRVFPDGVRRSRAARRRARRDLAGTCGCRPTGSTKRCMPCSRAWRRGLSEPSRPVRTASPESRARRRSRSAIPAATRASSARPTRRG